MKKKWLITSFLFTTVMLYAQEAEVAAPEEPAQEVAVDAEQQEVSMLENETSSTEKIFVDNVGYTLKQGDMFYASPMARFEVQGIDEQSGLENIFVSIDGGEYAPYKAPIALIEEGNHTISYKFVDRVGNVSYSKVFEVYIDATAPRVLELLFDPVPYKASGYTYVGLNTKIGFKVFDDITGVAFAEFSTNNQDFVRYENEFTLSNLGYTSNSILHLYYKATDMVSNVTQVRKTTLYLDAAPPVVDVFARAYETNGIRYISSREPVYVGAFDAETKVDKILFSINDGEYQEYDEEIAIRLKDAGEYDVKVKAIDIVGNESDEVVYSVVVDMQAPSGDASYIGDADSTAAESAQPVANEENLTSSSEEDSNEENTDSVAIPTEEEPTTLAVEASNEVPSGEIAPVTE